MESKTKYTTKLTVEEWHQMLLDDLNHAYRAIYAVAEDMTYLNTTCGDFKHLINNFNNVINEIQSLKHGFSNL